MMRSPLTTGARPSFRPALPRFRAPSRTRSGGSALLLIALATLIITIAGALRWVWLLPAAAECVLVLLVLSLPWLRKQ